MRQIQQYELPNACEHQSLCTNVAQDTAQNIPDNLPSLRPDELNIITQTLSTGREGDMHCTEHVQCEPNQLVLK